MSWRRKVQHLKGGVAEAEDYSINKIGTNRKRRGKNRAPKTSKKCWLKKGRHQKPKKTRRLPLEKSQCVTSLQASWSSVDAMITFYPFQWDGRGKSFFGVGYNLKSPDVIFAAYLDVIHLAKKCILCYSKGKLCNYGNKKNEIMREIKDVFFLRHLYKKREKNERK